GPAGVPDDAVDRPLDLLDAAAELRELSGARLDHLREPVEHLAAVVRGRLRPAGLRRTSRAHRVARVLPRPPRDVLLLGLVRSPRLAARERAVDEELVRLLHREPAHPPHAS